MIDHIRANLVEARDALDRLISDDTQLGNIQAGASLLIDALRSGRRVIYISGEEAIGQIVAALPAAARAASDSRARMTA